MTVQIGRAVLPDPTSGRWSGETLTLEGTITPTVEDDFAHSFGMRQQVLGLAQNRDEPVVPVVFTTEPDIDGFFRPVSATVSGHPRAMAYSVVLERVAGGFARPMFESVVTTAVRTNAHFIASANAIVGALPVVPLSAASREYDYTTFPSAAAGGTLVTADGDVEVITAASPNSGYWSGYVRPESVYIGAARIEVLYGTTWLPVIGQQIPLGVAGNWRISNGFCRVYPSATGAGGKKGFTVETYRAGNWRGCEFAGWTYSTLTSTWIGPQHVTGDANEYSSPTILVNSPEVVSLRVAGASGKLTLTLRTGETWVVAQLSGINGLGRTTATASTVFTGGLRATGNDANGLRYLMASAAQTGAGSQTDATNGRIQTATTYPKVYAVTADYQVGPFTTDLTVRDGFYGAVYSRRRVVAR